MAALGLPFAGAGGSAFKRFAEDVGPRPAGRCHFERIRASGNYTPGNWQWIRPKGTGNPKTLYITYHGETLGIRQWAEQLGISRQATQYRIDRCRELGLDASEALLVPKPRSGGRGGRRFRAICLPGVGAFSQLILLMLLAMNDRQRQLTFIRFMEIEAELAALAEDRVVDGDPATVEGELLEEQEEIEFALGEDYLERRERD